MIAKKIVIVDDDIQYDKRVQLSIGEEQCEIVDLRTISYTAGSLLFGTIYFLKSCLQSFINIKNDAKVLARLGIVPNRSNPFAGLKAAFFWSMRAYAASLLLKTKGKAIMHAHDLYAALAVTIVEPSEIEFVYDAHEFEINRNRKNGFLRLLLEYNYEKRILKKASRLIVVNHRIKTILHTLYAYENEKIDVIYNDFYALKELPSTQKSNGSPTLVYVGKGIKGRMLENLDRENEKIYFEFHCFLLNTVLPEHISAQNWHIYYGEYLSILSQLQREKRCMMWCCLEIKSLSYKLALPNKFFQALSLGMPIVASEGTYLAEITEKYNIGVIYNRKNLKEIYDTVEKGGYNSWVENVLALRAAIKNETIKI